MKKKKCTAVAFALGIILHNPPTLKEISIFVGYKGVETKISASFEARKK